MGINNQEIIGDEALQSVTGGAGGAEFDAKRKEFDDAWVAVGMESKGFSGMKRSELFDEWQMSKDGRSATTFLLSC